MRSSQLLARLFFVIMTMVGLASPLAKAQSPKREALKMAELAERRIQSSIQNYLGPKSRSIVNVYVKEAVPVPGESSLAGSQSSWDLPGSYIPRAAESGDPAGFSVASADIVIQVETNVTPDMQNEIRAISARVLRGMKTNIKVTASLEAPLASQDAERTPASVDKTPFELLLEKFGGAIPVVAALVVVVGMLAAFGMLGVMLKSSAREIAEGIKIVRTQVTNSGSQKIELSGEFSRPGGAIENKPETAIRPMLPPLPLTGVEAQKQIDAIESYLVSMPLLFVRAFGDGPEDLMGLKFLVAKVSPEAKAKLKELLGTEKILKASRYQAGTEVVGFDARGWIQGLIERIEIRQLIGGSVVEESLNTEESLLLSTASEAALFEAALKSADSATWRVVTDFVSAEYLKKRSPELDEIMLEKLILSSAVIEQADVSRAAKNLIEVVRVSISETSVLGASRRDSEQHFEKKLLPSFVDAILSKELGEDDRLLARLSEIAPEFEKTLHEKIWTSVKLDLLSDETLREVFNRLDGERKAYLIYILPQKHATRLEGFIPEGNAKKISLDMVARLRQSADERKRESMKALAREFLDYLRVQVLNGTLRLKDGVSLPGSTPKIAASAPRSAEAEIVDAETSQQNADDLRKAS